MFDLARVRDDFPILSREVNGQPLVYFDNAATSQKPTTVIESISDYYDRYNSNVHRGVHTLSGEATDAYEGARARIGQWFGVEDTGEVILLNFVSICFFLLLLRPCNQSPCIARLF